MKYSKYILTISVVLNLLLIGYLVGTQSMNIFSTKEKQGSQNRMINIISEADLSNDLSLGGASIGMSSDYLDALDFHPQYIRLGTTLFGKRV